MKISKDPFIVAKRAMRISALSLLRQDEVTYPVGVVDEQFTVLMEEQVA
jgi:hypothetical protein